MSEFINILIVLIGIFGLVIIAACVYIVCAAWYNILKSKKRIKRMMGDK